MISGEEKGRVKKEKKKFEQVCLSPPLSRRGDKNSNISTAICHKQQLVGNQNNLLCDILSFCIIVRK